MYQFSSAVAEVGRTTTEHELVIDVLDDLITFAYAWEGQLAVNDDLSRLRELIDVIRGAIDVDRSTFPWIEDSAALHVVIRVMNGLQAGARSGCLPDGPEFDAEWLNKPRVLSSLSLQMANEGYSDEIEHLIGLVLETLEREFMEEVKPFVTRQQVSAVVRKAAKSIPAITAVPIHADTVANIVHQFFLKRLSMSTSVQRETARHGSLAKLYTRQARGVLVRMVEEAFVARMVRELYPRAKDFQIEIDRYYPWGAFCIGPTDPLELLRLYADLNAAGILEDAKFVSRAPPPGQPLSADGIIRWGMGYCPRATSPTRSTGPQIYFDTDDAEILINGKRIQKRLVMALRYDQPVPDIQGKLRHYAQYLSRRGGRHRATDADHAPTAGKATGQLTSQALRERKPERSVLHDKSSVLLHICALMSLSLERSGVAQEMSRKKQHLTILETITQAGFRFSADSVRKACDRRGNEITKVKRMLAES